MVSMCGCAGYGPTSYRALDYFPAAYTPLPLVIETERTELESLLYDSLSSHHNEIDVSSYHFTTENVPSIYHFIKQYPELDYGPGFKAAYYSVGGVVTRMKITYPIEVEAFDEALAQAVDGAVTEIRSTIRRSSTQAEQVSAISDYIATHVAYAFNDDGATPNHAYSNAYSALVEGRGTCDAYADAFNLLARQFNLSVITVSGSTQTSAGENTHAWNLVEVDGQWYHVDTTWNDATPDEPGRALHIYLLISDEAIRGTRGLGGGRHIDWGAEWLRYTSRQLPRASSTEYDDVFWVYEEMSISYIAATFRELQTAFELDTIEACYQRAYDTKDQVVIYQFGLSTSEVRMRWSRLFPGTTLIITTPIGSDIAYAIQVQS